MPASTWSRETVLIQYAIGNAAQTSRFGIGLAKRRAMGRILLGVVIGVILIIWLLVSCMGAIF